MFTLNLFWFCFWFLKFFLVRLFLSNVYIKLLVQQKNILPAPLANVSSWKLIAQIGQNEIWTKTKKTKTENEVKYNGTNYITKKQHLVARATYLHIVYATHFSVLFIYHITNDQVLKIEFFYILWNFQQTKDILFSSLLFWTQKRCNQLNWDEIGRMYSRQWKRPTIWDAILRSYIILLKMAEKTWKE